MSRRVALWGNFGTGNWGNECTLQAVVHAARERLPEARLFCVCSEPDDTAQRHDLPSFPISSVRRRAPPGDGARRPPKALRVLRRLGLEAREWANVLRLTRGLDMVIMTGTGMLTDDDEGAFGLPYDMFKWSVAAKAWGRRLSFASVGVEPIRDPLARFFILTALRLADYRSYRDEQSREHLSRVGFDAGRDPVFPDLAFSLPERGPEPGTARSAAGLRVAVGLYSYRDRGARGGDDEAAYRAYLDKLARFVFWLLERGHDVRLIIGDLTYDEPVLRDLRALLASRGADRYRGRIEDEAASSVDDVMRQIDRSDVVVASRFHNVLLSLFLGKPVLSISYNVKNEALMGEMGLAEYCQTLDGLDVDRLVRQFVALQKDAERVRLAIAAKASAYREELDRQYEVLFGGGVGGLPAPRR